MYIYKSHMDGLYTSDKQLDDCSLHCDICGDDDWLVGYAETREEAWDLLKDDTDINGSGGWDYEYVQEFLKNWEEEVITIKHISLNVVEEIKKLLPETLEKDLQDDEIICPVCHGLGIIKKDYNFGVKEDDIEKHFKLNWYDNEYFTLCPQCYFGRLKTCKYCGKVLSKDSNRCDCEEFLEQEREERRIKYQETINKAKEIELKDAAEYIYDEQSEKYFSEKREFIDYYWDLYLGGDHYCSNFDEYFEKHIPKVLWNCKEVKMSIDADSIIENACDDLHEDARDNITDEKELQELLDKWCEKQSGTTTYYPAYREYIRVQKEWFE